MEKNVIVAAFAVESEGFQALSELRQAAGGDSYLVSAAALVKKEKDNFVYLDGFDTGVDTVNDAAKGGLIGMLVGIFGGPLGVLFGGSLGTLIGMNVDAADEIFGLSMLTQVADKLDDGMVALIALADEKSPDAIDAKLSAHETIIARFDAEAVAEDVNRAYEKQAEMARLAKLDLQQKKEAEIRKSVEDGVEKFKSDMAFTANEIKEAAAEFDAERRAQHEKNVKEFEENSEILRQGFKK